MSIRYLVPVAVLCVACSSYATVDYWPTDSWRTSPPEQQGMDSGVLADVMGNLVDKPLNIHSLTIARHGYVVLDAYFAPFSADSQHDVASVTKSVTATLIGVAIDKGLIRSVDEPMLSFFPDRTVANLNDRKKSIKLRHLLTMSSGLKCVTEPGEVTLMEMLASPDWVQYVLDLPMEYEPGSKFVYNSAGCHLLSAILRQATGMSEFEFAKQNLFGPLGITEVTWPMEPKGKNNHGWGDLRLTPHDMAKLGLLYLEGGRWDGQQVISPEWVMAATTRQVDSNNPMFPKYGYLWWLRDGLGYNALGRGSQRIHVLPEKDLIIVTTAGIEGPSVKRITDLPARILSAIKADGTLPANAAGLDAMAARVDQALTMKAQPRPVPQLPRTARRVSGNTYAMAPNLVGLSRFSVSFPGNDEGRLILGFKSGPFGNETVDLAVGLDDVPRITPKGRNGLPAAAKGAWKDDKTFVVDLNEISNINVWLVAATFDKDTVTVELRSLSGLGQQTLTGNIEK